MRSSWGALMPAWTERCRAEGCTEGIYGDRYCQAHYWDHRHTVLMEALAGSEPTHPDLLPVKPLRVEWGRSGWAAYMPLPAPREDHPCRDHPEDFFAEEGDRAAASTEKWKRAMTSCMRCPSRVPCAEYGIAHSRDFGIWGGTTPKDRKRILRVRGQVFVELHAAWGRDDMKKEAS